MIFLQHVDDSGVEVRYSVCETEGGAGESHAILLPLGTKGNFEAQLKALLQAFEAFGHKMDVQRKLRPVLLRFFLSDIMNQIDCFRDMTRSLPYPISLVQQSPLSGAKVGLWVYANTLAQVEEKGDAWLQPSGTYTHLWQTQLLGEGKDTYQLTDTIFNQISSTLEPFHFNLKDHCLRTWLYVNNVDYNYAQVVEARKANFERKGMTQASHYIASTGIEGKWYDVKQSIFADAYSVGGLKQEQITFLRASDFMNPTYEYGVTFERATSVDYGDRKQVFISGTASIDNKGNILHRGDIHRQMERAMVNVDALLVEAECQLTDIAQMIVYVRDFSDTAAVRSYFDEHYADVPRILVHAAVCRPGWLVEIECIAIKAVENKAFDVF